MTASERRQEIINILIHRRQETAVNLAAAFDVSERTIRSDLLMLTEAYPIEPVCGRYAGGYKLADWYHPDRKVLTREQIDAVRKAAPFLEDKDRQALMSILIQFTAP